jgi:RNA polymerase sigma factor (sigma-70 family)
MSLAIDPRVQSYCRHLARKYGGRDRDDAYQEGLAAVIEHEPRGKRWAMNAAEHRVWSAMRARIRAERLPSLYRDWRASLSRERVDTIDVTDLMDRLSPVQRRVIRLRLWDGLSEAEAAAAMGIPKRTAETIYRRGLLKLRGIYGAV